MSAGVYTCLQFSHDLPAILRRHPSATKLRLQLLPPAEECPQVRGTRPEVTRLQSIENTCTDFVTFYALLLRCDNDGGNEKCVSAYTVVGHTSHISIHWCAQLQRSLSITSLLAAPTRSCVWCSSGFDESELVSIMNRETVGAVSSFHAQLSPYVPPLQWCRAVDGVLGSHHLVCSSYACMIDRRREHNDDRSSAAHPCAQWEEDELSRSPPMAAASTAITNADFDTPILGPPERRPRFERLSTTMENRTAEREETPSRSSTYGNMHLPLRLAAVLNGSVPLDSASTSIPGTRVLCLVALDGLLLTGGTPSGSPSLPSQQQDLFDTVCDFVSREVMPRVSLGILDGKWARAEGSAHLLDDVCQVRKALGTSYVAQYPLDAAAPAATRARSIVMVLDLSLPLQELFSRTSSIQCFSQKSKTDAEVVRQRRFLALQVAGAVQDTIGQLVSQHLDVFTFTRGNTATTEGTSGVQLPRRLSHLTCDMYCRSIAASVAQIFSLSPHVAFTEEVVRLLWGSTTADDNTDVTLGNRLSRESLRASQRQPAQIQRRIEERLMSTVPP